MLLVGVRSDFTGNCSSGVVLKYDQLSSTFLSHLTRSLFQLPNYFYRKNYFQKKNLKMHWRRPEGETLLKYSI